jgi:hypothetical protein
MLVTLPSFASLFKSLCLPMIHIDGAFSKNPLYDGSVLMLVRKLGNGGLLFVASLVVSHCPVESSAHLVWFILVLRSAGLDVESVPWFSNHGNLLAASYVLFNQHVLELSIKYYLEHLM